jgi:uroporphyrin-III C-methyltransferase
MKGKVYLVGAGPGDPELLTLKALKLLRSADAVLHDGLVSPEIVALAAPSARIYNVGKRCGAKSTRQEEIHFLMIALASAGLQVVRLKGGDPLIFGRAGEEIDALARANVPYEIVPGITSALGAASAASIALTDRRTSSALILLTGHNAGNNSEPDWKQFAGTGATLVVYMPGNDCRAISRKLMKSGFAGRMPCAIISRATTPFQQVHRTTVAQLSKASSFPAPALLIIGETVGTGERNLAERISAASFPNIFASAESLDGEEIPA